SHFRVVPSHRRRRLPTRTLARADSVNKTACSRARNVRPIATDREATSQASYDIRQGVTWTQSDAVAAKGCTKKNPPKTFNEIPNKKHVFEHRICRAPTASGIVQLRSWSTAPLANAKSAFTRSWRRINLDFRCRTSPQEVGLLAYGRPALRSTSKML